MLQYAVQEFVDSLRWAGRIRLRQGLFRDRFEFLTRTTVLYYFSEDDKSWCMTLGEISPEQEEPHAYRGSGYFLRLKPHKDTVVWEIRFLRIINNRGSHQENWALEEGRVRSCSKAPLAPDEELDSISAEVMYACALYLLRNGIPLPTSHSHWDFVGSKAEEALKREHEEERLDRAIQAETKCMGQIVRDLLDYLCDSGQISLDLGQHYIFHIPRHVEYDGHFVEFESRHGSIYWKYGYIQESAPDSWDQDGGRRAVYVAEGCALGIESSAEYSRWSKRSYTTDEEGDYYQQPETIEGAHALARDASHRMKRVLHRRSR